MQEFDHTTDQEHYFSESVKKLSKVNRQLAKLLVQKEVLTHEIIHSLGHDHEGLKSYDYGVWKIEVKTPFVYALNKKLYESGDIKLPDNFNPIKASVSYSIDKRLIDKCLEEAPRDVRDALIELIEKRPGKAAVNIRERV